jgi:hypothetical protein
MFVTLRNPMPLTPKRERHFPLGFAIEDGMIIFNSGGARRANDVEMELWALACSYNPAIKESIDVVEE